MILFLEQKKLHRTGYLPIFLAGGILAAIVPLVNMAVRPDSFTGLSGRAFPILMDANWGMMAQLTILLAVCGCCLIYHTEYADKGDLKMNTLPIRQFSLFFGKFGISLLSVTDTGRRAGTRLLPLVSGPVCEPERTHSGHGV